VRRGEKGQRERILSRLFTGHAPFQDPEIIT